MNQNSAAFITGASRGIGAAIALDLSHQGYHIFLNFQNNQAQAEKIAHAIIAQKGTVDLLPFNVADPVAVDAVFHEIQKKNIPLDILVNNAGMCKDNLLLRASVEEIHQTLDINLKGAIYCTKAASRIMIKQKKGSIISISSLVGERGNAGQSIYAASKAGLIGFSKSMAQELASRNIRVNVITPGFIHTDMTNSLSELQKNQILNQIPLKRFGTPQDIAWMVRFLGSSKSSFITGQTISINGGQSM